MTSLIRNATRIGVSCDLKDSGDPLIIRVMRVFAPLANIGSEPSNLAISVTLYSSIT
jgi:hypothetical protein